MTPTLLSTFTGLGGLDAGLEAAGFMSVGCIERDEHAVRSLKSNRGGIWPILEPGDISQIAPGLRPSDLNLSEGELTLLAGAPPCQPFSKAAQWAEGARRGMSDDRAFFIQDFFVLLETFLPAIVLIENVSGFVRGATSAMKSINATLDKINAARDTAYRAGWRIIDAADYGVAQHRHRAILVITRDGFDFSWPEPTHSDAPTTAWDAIGDLALHEELPRCSGKWARLIPSIPEGSNYLWHTGRGGGLPLFGWRTRYWSFLLKLAKDLPSWTLPAHPGPATGPFHWEDRPLAIEEMLRLQSFDSSWHVEGDRWVDRVMQVGNATPPLLGEVLGLALLRHVGMPAPSEPLTHAIQRAGAPPPPTAPTEVPPEYLELVGEHAEHPGHGRGPQARAIR